MNNYEKVLISENTINLNPGFNQKIEDIKRKEFINQVIHISCSVVLFILILWICYVSILQTSAYNSNNVVKTTIKRNNRIYSVQVWKNRVKTMRNMGYSATRILDILTILNMECGSYKGNCFNGNDIGPFQINKVHKEQYNKSWKYYNNKNWAGLFIYQLKYANKLLDSYEKRFCGEHIFKMIGKTYNNKARFECIGKSYNGHPSYKYSYVKLGWERRKVISNIIFKKELDL